MPPSADFLFTNARVFCADADQPDAEAVGVKGKRIVFVGGNREANDWRGAGTRVIDGQGRTLLPGFIDCHYHLLGGSTTLDDIHLENVTNYDGMLAALLDYAAGHPQANWLAGYGLRYNLGPGNVSLQRQHIDAAVAERPVILFAYDYHTAWANTLALQLAGLAQGGECGPNSAIVLDEHGLATGELREDGAYDPIVRLLPEPDAGRKRALLKKGLELAAQVGVTSVHNMDGEAEQAALYASLEAEGELTARVYLAYSVTPHTPLEALEQEALALKRRYASGMLRAGSVKLFMDGVIESYTGLLLDDYADRPGCRGAANYAVEHFERLVVEADRLGLQVCVHAVGDLGVRRVLDACQAAQRANGRRDSRHRLEHIEVIHPADLPRFAGLGVIASMQPLHAPPSGDCGDVWLARAGAGRWPLSFAWQHLRAAGATLVFGSDWPVASQNPLLGLAATQTRQTWQAGMPDQRQALGEALLAYTRQAAFAEFQEAHKGQLKAGYLADMVLLSEDIFDTQPEDLAAVRPWVTMVDGRMVYQG